MQEKQKKLSIVICTIAAVTLFTLSNLLEPSDNSINHPITDSTPGSTLVGPSEKSLVAAPKHAQDATTLLGYESKIGKLPESLSGVPLTVKLLTDSEGHLIVSNDIKHLFDYFLSTIEEDDLDTIISRIDEYLNFHLEEPALSEAKSIFAQYIAYKEALVELEHDMEADLSLIADAGMNPLQHLDHLRTRLDQRNELRSLYLESEINKVFYGDEQTYDEYSYQRLVITSDKSLSSKERQNRITQLQQQLPENMQTSIRQTSISDELKLKTEKILSSGGSHEEVRELRRNMFGEEAVERFDELDQRRQQWKARVADYLAQRESILNTEGIDQGQIQTQIKALRDSMFDEREQLRIIGMEKSAG